MASRERSFLLVEQFSTQGFADFVQAPSFASGGTVMHLFWLSLQTYPFGHRLSTLAAKAMIGIRTITTNSTTLIVPFPQYFLDCLPIHSKRG